MSQDVLPAPTQPTDLAEVGGAAVALGAAASAAAIPVVTATDDARIGTVTEAAPGTDTASSGLNGRLQRIAQRLTSIIALLPAALGAGGGLKVDGSGTALPVSGTVTATGPLTDTELRATAVPVSAASLPLPAGAATSALQGGGLPAALGAGGGLKVDGSGTALPVSGTVSTNDVGTGTNAASQVAISNSSTTIIASRAGRRGVLLVNNQTVAVYVDPSGGTAATSHFRLDPGASVYLPVTSTVTGITAAAYTAAGDAKVHVLESY